MIGTLFKRTERFLSKNWFNPFLTFYLNLRSFPFGTAIKFPIFVYGRPKIWNTTGEIIIESTITSGMITLNKMDPWAPSLMTVQSEFCNAGTITFGGGGSIGTGTKICVYSKAKMNIGEDFKIADLISIGCQSHICIGKHAFIAHRCQIFDSDYHYVAYLDKGVIPHQAHPITIGDDCWICNSSTITSGAIIPDNTIVASCSLVNKDFSGTPSNSLIGGIPARMIHTNVKRVRNREIEKKLHNFFKDNPKEGMFLLNEDDFYIL